MSLKSDLLLQGSLLFQKLDTERFVLFFLIGSEQFYVFIEALDENISGTSALEGHVEDEANIFDCGHRGPYPNN